MRLEITIDELREMVQPKPDAPVCESHVYQSVLTAVRLSTIEFICQGRIVEAIKDHRAYTGAYLKESKDVCDAIRAVIRVAIAERKEL